MGGERPSHKGEQQLQVIHCVASVVAFVSPILTPGGWGGGGGLAKGYIKVLP